MNNRIQVVLVGCGNIARRAHVPAWLANPEVDLVALCDPNDAASQQIIDRYHLTCAKYHSLEELLTHTQPDVVDICSPGFLHIDQATQALKAGCNVLVEKPPAPSLKAAQDLANLAQHQGLKLGAVLNYRYRDLVMQLKQVADAGTLGQLVKVYITHHGPLIYTDAPWLWDEQRSKYLLREFAIHFIDILVYLLGQPKRIVQVLPIEQSSIGHTTDLEVTIEFANGALGRIEIVADTTRHSSFFTHINAYGTAMDAFVRWFPPSVRLVAGQVNPINLILDEVKSVWDIGSKILRGQFLKHRNISHYRVIDAYVDWIAGREDYPLSFEEILPTLRLLDEIEQQVPSYQKVYSSLSI